MPLLIEVRDKKPQMGENCFLAENATLIGDVVLGNNSSVWYGAVLRGDVNFIHIGDNTNIQDNASIHGTFEKTSTTIGNNVTIGHNAVIHGCTIKDHALIGMGAIVLDGAVVGESSVVAAGAVVREGMIIEESSLYAGVPAKKIKTLTEEEKKKLLSGASHYIEYASWYRKK